MSVIRAHKTIVLYLVTIAAFCCVLIPVHAQVNFGDLQASTGRVIFSAVTEAPFYGQYTSSFAADPATLEMRQLTVFPERLSLAQASGDIRIQNRFGLFRLDTENSSLQPEAGFPSFIEGGEIIGGKLKPVLASPDGAFVVYLEPVSAAFGNLMLYHFEEQKSTVIATDVELTFDLPPARWSPDGSMIVYSAGDQLFYYSMQQHRAGRVSDPSQRNIGDGSIHNVRWESKGSLYYATGSVVYRIRPNEFYARTMYRDIIRVGEIAGKLPFSFDPNFDRFYIAPDGEKMLFVKSERNVFLLFLDGDDYASAGQVITLPYLFLPRSTRIQSVLWSFDDIATVITESIGEAQQRNQLFRLDMRDKPDSYRFVQMEQAVSDASLDARHERILLLTSEGAEIRRYADWQLVARFSHQNPIHGVWIDQDNVLVAGSQLIEQYNIPSGNTTLIAFSQPTWTGFEQGTSRPVVAAGELERIYNWETATWIRQDKIERAAGQQATSEFRVYLETLPSSTGYSNQVMIRNAQRVGTRPLFAVPERKYEAFPEEDDLVDLRVFSHGSRIRRREVSLVFNAIDSVEGLTEILHVLRDYDIRATFFINGDFLARHPEAVMTIAESGHEVGNLFHAYFDMTDARFRITPDFIQQGLARNEDDYYHATGKEMSLLWHAPYYYVSSQILSAAEEVNYSYVGRDVDALDWVPRYLNGTTGSLYQPSADLIERIVSEKKPGSIIALRIGTPGDDKPFGGRDDYVFHRLDVLVNALVEKGYSFVPVSLLRDRVQ